MTQEKIYYLTDCGIQELADYNNVSKEDLHCKSVMYPLKSINHIYHRKQLINFLIALDKALEGTGTEIKYLATDGERDNREGGQVVATHIASTDGNFKLVPDITFVLRNQEGVELVFFVEIDTAKETIRGRTETTKKNTLLYKYDIYEKIYRSQNWKEYIDTTAKAFKVLTVTETDKHIDGIRNKVQGHIQWPEIFLFTTHGWVADYGILSDINIWLDLTFETDNKNKPIFKSII